MSRALRWALGLGLVAVLLIGALLVLPFRDWLPGGTVADIPTAQVVNGSAFNRLFPAPEAGQQIVFTQEKRGFAEARLKQGDELLGLLAISDTTTAPAARSKFSASAEQLGGWPLVEQGSQASALLVADRFQVKVIGQGSGLNSEKRHELLTAFDLKGLAALKSARTPKALPAGSQPPLRLPLPKRSPDQRTPEPALQEAA
ncbi:MAG: hypothetical protein R6W06_01940 [Prochlorococcaceae cyanobacterium]